MKKLNNDGLTLVEMLICMLISMVVVSAVGGFLSSTSISYQSADTEISLQTEAQTIINQISDMLLEANNAYYDSSNHSLTMYYDLGQKKTDGLGVVTTVTKTDAFRKIIWFNQADNHLYFYEIKEASGYDAASKYNAAISEINAGRAKPVIGQLLGEYVVDFDCDATEPNGLGTGNTNKGKNKMVKISVSLSKKRTNQSNSDLKKYIATNEVSLRNELVRIDIN